MRLGVALVTQFSDYLSFCCHAFGSVLHISSWSRGETFETKLLSEMTLSPPIQEVIAAGVVPHLVMSLPDINRFERW